MSLSRREFATLLTGVALHAVLPAGATTEPALRLLSQYAEFAGWLHQDVGDTNAATYWSDSASQWAQAVGDYQMVAYMLVRKSNIALLDDDAGAVIELAAAARKVPGPVSPKPVALAAQQEARGWALHGNAAARRTVSRRLPRLRPGRHRPGHPRTQSPTPLTA